MLIMDLKSWPRSLISVATRKIETRQRNCGRKPKSGGKKKEYEIWLMWKGDRDVTGQRTNTEAVSAAKAANRYGSDKKSHLPIKMSA
jgi:hypothetical protein